MAEIALGGSGQSFRPCLQDSPGSGFTSSYRLASTAMDLWTLSCSALFLLVNCRKVEPLRQQSSGSCITALLQ